MLARDYKLLTGVASQIAANAYSPYSGFRVGAAVVFEEISYTLFSGVNVENASYGLTICAERAAIFSGVAQGGRKLAAVAIACRNAENVTIPCFYPCGACLQVIAEFADKNTDIFLHDKGQFKLTDFLTTPFALEFRGGSAR